MQEKFNGRLLLPKNVRLDERKYIWDRRKSAGGVAANASAEQQEQQPLVGLALSGGGIRSATFSLGILQSLARANVLRIADYLCTVSGGGYIGSCLTSMMTVTKIKEDNWKREHLFDLHENMPLSGGSPDQIHHLRTHGEYLIPRNGFFRRDLLRTIGAFVLSASSSISLFLCLLISIVAMTLVLSNLLGGNTLTKCSQGADTASFVWPSDLTGAMLFAVLGCLPPLLFLTGWGTKSLPKLLDPKTADPGLTKDETKERVALKHFVGFLLGTLLFGVLVWAFFVRPKSTQSNFAWQLWPAVYFSSAYIIAIIVGISDSKSRQYWKSADRSVTTSVIGICFYGILLAFTYYGYVRYFAHDFTYRSGLLSGSGAAALASFVATKMTSTQRSRLSRRWSGVLINAIIAVSTIAFVGLCVLLITDQLLHSTGGTTSGLLLSAGSAAGLFFVLGRFIHFDQISPHYFYRDRLSESYLQTEVRTGKQAEVRRNDSKLPLSKLHDRFIDGKYQTNPCPYHLVQCALNLSGSNDLTRKDRKSDVFTFAKYFCGSTTTGYVKTKSYKEKDEEFTLATALTISGAAASSGMGFYTSFFQSFITTLFNIRLGMWLPNPSYSSKPSRSETLEQALYEDKLAESERTEVSPATQTNLNTPSEKFWAGFWPRYLVRELTAMTTANLPRINLSDGGHTGDNLGIYPLLQRRCKLIIVCDGENDPDYCFGSLIHAMRMINVDENVQVEFDIDDIRTRELDKLKHAKESFMIGRVSYPSSPETFAEDRDSNELGGEQLQKPTPADVATDYQEGTGWIIYLKSSFTGLHEPAAVKTYKAENDDFPHESTADQFFDDAQFEAYRQLGNHIAQNFLLSVRSLKHLGCDLEVPWDNLDFSASEIIHWAENQWEKAIQRKCEAESEVD